MRIEELNKLFESEEIKSVLKNIAKTNDFRMCLNKNIINEYRYYFADIIMLSFVVEIYPYELDEIYSNAENYLRKKLESKFGVKDIYNHKKIVEEYFNNNSDILFVLNIGANGCLVNSANFVFSNFFDDFGNVKNNLLKNEDK